MRSIVAKVSILLILCNQCFGYDRECKRQEEESQLPNVKFLTNNVNAPLSDTSCEFMPHIANIQMIQTSSNAISEQTYCNELNDILLKSTEKDVVVMLLQTPEAVPPCSYRVHTKSPVLLQVTNSSRHSTYNTKKNDYYFEFWLDSRFGQVREGPLRYIQNCTTAEKIRIAGLIQTLRLALHLAAQSEDAMIDDLYPRLKVMSDEALYKAWDEYRDKMDKESPDPMGISWFYVISLIILTAYSALIVFIPEPDHKVFVHEQELSEGRGCASEPDDSKPAPKDPHRLLKLGKKDYTPLSKFLNANKEQRF